jgi:hypothetical protein
MRVVSLQRFACDYLVGAGAKRLREHQPERLGGREISDKQRTSLPPGQREPASHLRLVAALVSNVHGLRHSVIIAKNAAPGKPCCRAAR